MKRQHSLFAIVLIFMLSPMTANAALFVYTSTSDSSGQYLTAEVDVTSTAQGVYSQDNGGLASFLISLFDNNDVLLYSIDDTEDNYGGFNSYIEFDASGAIVGWFLWSRTIPLAAYSIANNRGDISNCPSCVTTNDVVFDRINNVSFYITREQPGIWAPIPEPDTDEDGIPDDVDNCPVDSNNNQLDWDDDFLGDVCDTDDDNDTILDDVDNCPLVANLNQADVDGDGIGDVCDDDDDVGDDSDSDGVSDADDQCPLTDHDAVTDATGCSIAQLCPADGDWRNHGKYVRCVVRETRQFLRSGLITKKERRAIVREAAQSDIGKKRK